MSTEPNKNYTEAEFSGFEQANEQPEAPLPGPDAEEAAVGVPSPAPKKKHRLVTVGIASGIVFTALYIILNIAALKGLFSALLSVLAPVILGFAIAYFLNPILKLFEFHIFKKIRNKSVLRIVSMIATYVVMFGAITALLFLLIPQLFGSVSNLASNFNGYMENISNWINGTVSKVTTNEKFQNKVNPDVLTNIFKQFFLSEGNQNITSGVLSLVTDLGEAVVTGVKNFILAIFISIYVLSSKERLKAQTAKFVTAVFPANKARSFFKYMTLCNRTFGGFFVGMLADSLIIFMIMLTVLSILGFEYALLISTICGITNMIPFFGPFIGAIPSALIILISEGPKETLIFAIFVLILQQIDGNIIAPKILGKSTGISSLSVIISIIVMGEYFGILGMLIGVPIFAVIISIVTEILDTRLRAKNKSTDTAEYYSVDSLVGPHEKHQNLFAKLFSVIASALSYLFGKKRKERKENKRNKK